jgi:hypothetical protein
MKKIEIIDNKLNVDLKPNDKILLQSKSGIAKFEYISRKNDEHLIKRIGVERKNILYFTVSKFWFIKKGTATYLLGDD